MTQNNPLHVWCREGNYEKISQFIKACEDLPSQMAHHQGVYGHTPLHVAASSGHLNILELLLHHGGDVNCLTNTGHTPLHLAASGHHIECIMLLLAYGADDSIVDNSGKAPLQTAKLRGNKMKKLVKSAGMHLH